MIFGKKQKSKSIFLPGGVFAVSVVIDDRFVKSSKLSIVIKKRLVLFLFSASLAHGQGYNHQWLLGNYYFIQDPKGRMLIDSNGYSLVNENRKMVFIGTEANISDSNGNLLMSSNGVWIANAIGDTMMNGSGLNPSAFTSNWPFGQVITHGTLIIPYPDDVDRYLLFHQTGDWLNNVPSTELDFTTIDMTLDNGLGGVHPNEKNVILIQDTLSWGISACKHANGKDWWVVAMKDNSDLIYKILITHTGISTVMTQSLGIAPSLGAAVQLTFSQDGTKLICQLSNGGIITDHFVRILDFNRCTGDFSNPQVINLSPGGIGWGLAFSPSGKYAYACSSNKIFQIDTDNLNVDTVATYDGFISPGPNCCSTTFWNMYLAANGKIYVTTGSSTFHIHEINYPDSAGLACDVQQHSIFLGYAQLRAVPNHPNYYLGCDTTSSCVCLTTSLEEMEKHDFKFSVYPNPSNGVFKISYLLPQNENGKLEVYDVNGKRIYEMNLPPWSTMQEVVLPYGISAGVYNCVITSDGLRVNRKIAVITN